MNEITREIQRRNPLPPVPRARKGSWVTHSHAVRELVDTGWNVSDAVRQVVEIQNLHPPDKAFAGIRAAYYALPPKHFPSVIEKGTPVGGATSAPEIPEPAREVQL